MDADAWHHAECYERTYSRTLPVRGVSTTANDHAIAAALAGLSEVHPQPPAPNTSMDGELAAQLQEREQDKLLLRAPSAKRLRRRHKALRSLLHHLKPTQLVPRLNPRVEDPSASYVSEDRARLLLRLDCYGLQERVVTGDGNCQFRALADQLLFDQDRHGEVRQVVVDQLCCFPERYQDYVTDVDFPAYCSSMSKLGTWGDHVSLQAAADAYHVGINIITSFEEECVIGICPVPSEQQQRQPQQVVQLQNELKQEQQAHAHGEQEQGMAELQQAPHRDAPQATSPLTDDGITLWLAFWAEVHYNSIAPKSVDSSAPSEEGSSSSSEDEAECRTRFLGSTRLGRVFKHVM